MFYVKKKMNKPIPVNTPSLTGNELKYLSECIETGWISSEGPFISKFEIQFAQYIGREYGIAVSNGSAALDIAVQALNIGSGDEVIMPAFSIISPAQSIVKTGAKPVLIDCDPYTWNMDVTKIEQKITKATKAILIVHIYGLPTDVDPILRIAEKYRLKVIEDAAEMHGQTYRGKKCGSFGDISIFSFYPNKHITTGEGGMIMCNNEELAERCKKLRNLAFEPEGRRFVHEEMGWNYRMTNMQAAIGLAQLEQIDSFINKKRLIGSLYTELLFNLKARGYQLPIPQTDYADNIYWVFGIVAPTEHEQKSIVHYLSTLSIGTRPFFWCMHEQPVFRKMGLFVAESYEHSERIARNGFYIPSGLGLSTNDVKYVAQKILEFFK
jgi:perosamine synthetase